MFDKKLWFGEFYELLAIAKRDNVSKDSFSYEVIVDLQKRYATNCDQ